MTSHSSVAKRPAKPRSEAVKFSKHPTGRWCKKAAGNLHYFGRIADDPDAKAALAQWNEQRDELLAGKTQKQLYAERAAAVELAKHEDGFTVADLVNNFLTEKTRMVADGELSQRTLDDYILIGKRLSRVFGRDTSLNQLKPADFATLRDDFRKTHGLVALKSDIVRTRVFFAWGSRNEHGRTGRKYLEKPIDYGDKFKVPSAKALRKEQKPKRQLMFSREEVLAVLNGNSVNGQKIAGATLALRAMFLLALNGGLGNEDIAQLPMDPATLDLEAGWLDYSRRKTGVERRIPLWPETVKALKAWLKVRPEPKPVNKDLVFVTRSGNSWTRTNDDNPISKEMAKLLKRLGIHRPGLNFYSGRRTFRTIAAGSLDEQACDYLMGHAPESDDMAKVYILDIWSERLVAVTDYVRNWLFAPKKPK